MAVDHTIEQTLNKDTKTKGGIIGFSLNKGAVQRWILTAHERAAILRNFKNMLQITEDLETTLKEARGPRIERDEKDVIKVAEQVENWGNPFEQSEELSSLSSGRIATKEISDDLLSAKKTGEEATMTFMKERVISNNEDLFSPITRLKSKTFADLSKKTTIKLQNKEEILKADRTLFARMVVVAQSREMDMRDVLKHSLGPLPWSLAAVDGSYAKTTKSKLAELIEKGTDTLEGEPDAAVWILDAMAILQALTNIPPTFADLADQVFSVVMHMGSNAVRIDFVADRYP